jgi:mono/diheme cytochrome c family protein
MRATYGGAIAVGAVGLAIGAMLSQAACRTTGSTTSATAGDSVASLPGHALFTAHCAPCHGANGGGKGPAAIALSIAPRDFRHERFRYVSTMNGVPSDEDLVQSIRYGRRYGEMPAGPQLTDAEVRTLVGYIREVQRFGWLDELRKEFADDDDTSPEEIEEISHLRVKPRDAIHVGRPDATFRPDTDAGRVLYAANCASCHGLTGRGDGLAKPLDEQGNPISVRDLTTGEFRGGSDVAEVFKRIRCGVPGTPMSSAVALSDEEVWQLVYYVRFLAGQR